MILLDIYRFSGDKFREEEHRRLYNNIIDEIRQSAYCLEKLLPELLLKK